MLRNLNQQFIVLRDGFVFILNGDCNGNGSTMATTGLGSPRAPGCKKPTYIPQPCALIKSLHLLPLGHSDVPMALCFYSIIIPVQEGTLRGDMARSQFLWRRPASQVYGEMARAHIVAEKDSFQKVAQSLNTPLISLRTLNP